MPCLTDIHVFICLIIGAVCMCQSILFVTAVHALFAVTQSSLCCKIDDPELTCEGQPTVPETLLLLHQKVERLSKPIQALHDLADILV